MAARSTSTSKQGDPQPETDQREDLRTEPTIDVVAMLSRRADGSPDQTKGFLVVGEDGEKRSVAEVEAEAEAEAKAKES